MFFEKNFKKDEKVSRCSSISGQNKQIHWRTFPRRFCFRYRVCPKDTCCWVLTKKGRCPKLIDNKCSIYEHRPLGCRSFDGRVFVAASIPVGDSDNILIIQQIKRWKFNCEDTPNRDLHLAVQSAATFLRKHADCFPNGTVPNNFSQLAIFAIEVYNVFLGFNNAFRKTGHMRPDSEIVKVILKVNEEFEKMWNKNKFVLDTNMFGL